MILLVLNTIFNNIKFIDWNFVQIRIFSYSQLIIEILGGVNITLKNLFDNYEEFEEIILENKENMVDLDDMDLTPTMYMLLMMYDKIPDNPPGLNLTDLPNSKENQQNVNFIENIIQNLNLEYGGSFVLRHILSELTYNIHEHAFNSNQKTEACIYIKEDFEEEKLEISILDFGLSIPGRFDKSGVEYYDDCNAIEKAINNFSTASTNPYERGNGLWTTIRLIVEGNGGEILIVSRRGLLFIDADEYKYRLLGNGKIFKGTLISIKLNKHEVQNIYDLIELPKTNFYRYGG